MKICPTCGQSIPETNDERRARLSLGVQQRLQDDIRQILPRLEDHFVSSDVGRALRSAGRSFSQHAAVLGRLKLGGFIAPDGLVPGDKRKTIRWRVVTRHPDA